MGTLQSVNEATRTEWMRISLFSTGFRQIDVGGGGRWISARTGVPLLQVGEREAKVVDSTCEMFGAMRTADAEEVELSEKAMTILCDMLAACNLLEVLSFRDFTLLDAEVWTDLAAIPLRANMPSTTTFSWPFTWRTAASTRLDGKPSQTQTHTEV